jgi:hypothetical protein
LTATVAASNVARWTYDRQRGIAAHRRRSRRQHQLAAWVLTGYLLTLASLILLEARSATATGGRCS